MLGKVWLEIGTQWVSTLTPRELSIKIKDEYVRRLRRTWPILA